MACCYAARHFFSWVFSMFNSQFNQLEQSIQRLLQDNQQLQQALAQKDAEIKAQRDELELLQLGMMESEEQAQQAASRFDALLSLFPQAGHNAG